MEQRQAPAQHTVGQRILAGLTIVALVALIILLVVTGRSLWHYFRHPAELRQVVSNWGAWAPFGIVLFQMVQVIIAPLPGNAMSFAAGYALGVWPTIVWLMLGVLAGATVDFLLIRLLGRRLLKFFLSPARLERLDSLVVRRGTFYIFLLLLVPNPVGDWVYYLAGLSRMPLPLFLVLVLAARTPSNLLEAAIGAGATRFAWQHWVLLGLAVVLLTVLYLKNQQRIEAFLLKLSRLNRR
jgi:uncharacterized membrane protein YdjX (TVP38/TMEM64 family)